MARFGRIKMPRKMKKVYYTEVEFFMMDGILFFKHDSGGRNGKYIDMFMKFFIKIDNIRHSKEDEVSKEDKELMENYWWYHYCGRYIKKYNTKRKKK